MRQKIYSNAAALVVAAFFCAACLRHVTSEPPAHVPTAAVESTDPIDADVVGLTPIAIFQPAPEYPMLARRGKLFGYVVLEIVVDENGNVASARVIKSDALFDEAALECVRKWRYQPLLFHDRALAWRSRVQLHFRPR